jgi:hypothetical protein
MLLRSLVGILTTFNVVLANMVTIDEVMTYRAFCRIGEAVLPLSSIYPFDGILRHEEAAFWAFLWAGHTLGSESIYRKLVKRLGSEISDHVIAILGHMQLSLGRVDLRESPLISGDKEAESILQKILGGKYEEAHREIEMFQEEKPRSALGADLMMAELIARFPASIYSPSTSRIMLTGKFKKDLRQLIAVRCVHMNPEDIPTPALLGKMEPDKVSNWMFIHFVAGNFAHAATFGGRLLSDETYGETAHEIVAASLLCSSKDTLEAQQLYSSTKERWNSASPAVKIGMHLAQKRLGRQNVLALYAKYAISDELRGHFPLINVGPTTPGLYQVIVPMLSQEVLHLSDIRALKIGKGNVSPISIPVTRHSREELNMSDIPSNAKLATTTAILSLIKSPKCLQCKNSMNNVDYKTFLTKKIKTLDRVKMEDTLSLSEK